MVAGRPLWPARGEVVAKEEFSGVESLVDIFTSSEKQVPYATSRSVTRMAPDEQAFRVDPDTMAHLKTLADDFLEDTVAVFKALGDERRPRILRLLRESELRVCDLVEIFDLEYSKLSYHLKQLRETGPVETDRDGNFVTYELTDWGRTAAEQLGAFHSGDAR